MLQGRGRALAEDRWVCRVLVAGGDSETSLVYMCLPNVVPARSTVLRECVGMFVQSERLGIARSPYCHACPTTLFHLRAHPARLIRRISGEHDDTPSINSRLLPAHALLRPLPAPPSTIPSQLIAMSSEGEINPYQPLTTTA